jgi:hypothetical protein
MAAPSPTVRQTPNGIRIDDGFKTLITFSRDPDVCFWEKTVQPPGLDGGDAIETTTMHNTAYRTMAPRQLVTLTEMNTVAAYDPDIYNNILSLLNVEDTITVRFPDGSTLAFFGFLRTFEPAELSEGEQPTATINISPTNVQPGTSTEYAPVLTSVAGT